MTSALQIQNSSSSHLEWHETARIFQEAKKVMFSISVTDKERCEYLENQKDESLLDFYEEIYATQKINQLKPCAENLDWRVRKFLFSGTERLKKIADNPKSKLLRKCSDRKSNTFGPETDYFIDPKNGERLFGDFLPKCTLAFTFDDGPHKTLTPKLLDILKDQDVLVNFFVVGQRVNSSPQILKDTHAEGHLIGNHSMTHADLRKLSYKSATAEIDDNFTLITKTLGQYLPFFRFPYGASTKQLREYLSHFSRVEFFWNVDTLDWKYKDPDVLYKYTLQQIDELQHGSVLMHDVQPQTIAALPYIFKALRENGYSPVIIRPTPDKKK